MAYHNKCHSFLFQERFGQLPWFVLYFGMYHVICTFHFEESFPVQISIKGNSKNINISYSQIVVFCENLGQNEALCCCMYHMQQAKLVDFQSVAIRSCGICYSRHTLLGEVEATTYCEDCVMLGQVTKINVSNQKMIFIDCSLV